MIPLNQSVHTQSWCETYRDLEPKFSLLVTLNSGCGDGDVMVVEDEFQSQPCLTIQYTNGEGLEGLRCCELPESVSIHSIWVRKSIWSKPNLYQLMTRK